MNCHDLASSQLNLAKLTRFNLPGYDQAWPCGSTQQHVPANIALLTAACSAEFHLCFCPSLQSMPLHSRAERYCLLSGCYEDITDKRKKQGW